MVERAMFFLGLDIQFPTAFYMLNGWIVEFETSQIAQSDVRPKKKIRWLHANLKLDRIPMLNKHWIPIGMMVVIMQHDSESGQIIICILKNKE